MARHGGGNDSDFINHYNSVAGDAMIKTMGYYNMLYQDIQLKVLGNIMGDPYHLIAFKAIVDKVGGECTDYFDGVAKVFFMAAQFKAEKRAAESVLDIVKKSKASKDYTVKELERVASEMESVQPLNTGGFGALAGHLIYIKKTFKPLPPVTLVTEQKSVLSEKQIGYLHFIRKHLKKDGWNKAKLELGIKTPGTALLSRSEANELIKYYKEGIKCQT